MTSNRPGEGASPPVPRAALACLPCRKVKARCSGTPPAQLLLSDGRMIVVPAGPRDAVASPSSPSSSSSSPKSPTLTSGAGISPDSEIPADHPCARCARLGKNCVWAPSHRTGRPKKNPSPGSSQRLSPTQPSSSTVPDLVHSSPGYGRQQQQPQQHYYSDYSPQSDIISGHRTHSTRSALIRTSSSELLRNFFAEVASMTPAAEATVSQMSPLPASPELAPPPSWSNLHPITESLQAAALLSDSSSALTAHQQQQQHQPHHYYHYPPPQQQQAFHDLASPRVEQPTPFFDIHSLEAGPDASGPELGLGSSYWSPPGNISPHPASMPTSEQPSPHPQQQHLYHSGSGAFLPEAFVSTAHTPMSNLTPSESDSDFIDRLLGNVPSSSMHQQHHHHHHQQQQQQQQQHQYQYQQHQHQQQQYSQQPHQHSHFPSSAPTTPASFQDNASTGMSLDPLPAQEQISTDDSSPFFSDQMSHCALQLQQRQMARSASMSAAAGNSGRPSSSPTPSTQARSSSIPSSEA